MALQSGARLGPYEITAQIGVGGMGEVYRATDTKLDREVAIKVLQESLAGDSDRIARFQREAKTLASLNHPNIAAIYGLVRLARERPPHRRRSPLGSAFTRGRNPHLTKWRQCRHCVESVLRPRGSWNALSSPMRASRSKY